MLKRLETQIDSLSRAERQVGEWVLANPREAARSTLANLARHCGTSEPTVIRFCRRIGLKSFRELALSLTEAMSDPSRIVHSAVSESDAPADAAVKVLDAAILSLMETRSELAGLPFERAAATFKAARQIVFAGLGASGRVAADACNKFFRLGTPCSALTDGPSIRQFAAIAGSGDCVVLISQSDRWRDLRDAARLARDNGADVIAVTDPDSELAAAASLVFGCFPSEDLDVFTPMSSRLTQLVLLDALQVAFALSLGNDAVLKLRASKAVLETDRSRTH